MKSILRAVAGAVIAATATFASAQSTTLDFDDLQSLVTPGNPATYSGILGNYKGFDFSNATGTTGTWAWYTSAEPLAGSPSPLINITGSVDVLPVPNDTLEAFVIKTVSGLPFTLQSLWVAGAPVYLELLDTTGGLHFLGGFDGTNAFGNGVMTNPLTGDATRGVYSITPPLLQNLELAEVAVWSLPGVFAVDDIKVTVVPEPSSYAMLIAGVGVLLVAARRRKAQGAA